VNPGAASPAPGLFSFEPFPGLRRHNPAGGFCGPVSIHSAASEYIPLGGAVLLWNVPNSPIGGSFGVARFALGGPDSVPNRVSAAVMAGSVGPRSLRCHANGFTARPIIPLGAGLRIIAIGIAWPFILAVCVGIEESAVARLLDHCLGQHRRCGQARQNGHHSKEPRSRHWLSPLRGHGCMENNTRASVPFLISAITQP
jgi:hypothetical protein